MQTSCSKCGILIKVFTINSFLGFGSVEGSNDVCFGLGLPGLCLMHRDQSQWSGNG